MHHTSTERAAKFDRCSAVSGGPACVSGQVRVTRRVAGRVPKLRAARPCQLARRAHALDTSGHGAASHGC